MTEQQFKICSRLAKCQEGRDFLEEIIRPMQKDNYKDLLREGKEVRDELVGFGGCLDTLVDLLENCDKRLLAQEEKPPEDWA